MSEGSAFALDGWTMATILAMTLATYACRVLGVWLMGHVPLTRRVRRALAALPGSIILSTVLPLAVKGGPAATLAMVAALASMLLRRNELLALAVGMAVASAARAAGL